MIDDDFEFNCDSDDLDEMGIQSVKSERTKVQYNPILTEEAKSQGILVAQIRILAPSYQKNVFALEPAKLEKETETLASIKIEQHT